MAGMSELRKRMVAHHLAARGINNSLVLAAMEKVPREAFLPRRLRGRAYADAPLPIGKGQTISQPYIVAFMVEALQLEGGETVLEIGAGSGYAAAVLAEIAREVYTVERISQLAEKAARTLTEAGYTNVHVKRADGTQGWGKWRRSMPSWCRLHHRVCRPPCRPSSISAAGSSYLSGRPGGRKT